MVRRRTPPSPTWRAFLANHVQDLASLDFFTVATVHFEILFVPRSPWQNPYVERMIGSIQRECLAHVVVLSERHLRRVLGDYLAHYHDWRCHRSLAMDCPAPRPVQPPEVGPVVEVAEAGGLYRHYERRAA